MKTLIRYLKIWWMLSINSFSMVFAQRGAMAFLLIGKVLRFTFFFGFLYFLVSGVNKLVGYSVNQVILFFLTFYIVDVISQFFFREVYRFRPKIVSGDFDLSLIKPINPLFQSLAGGADVIDLVTIPPLLIATIYFAALLAPDFWHSLLYIFLVFNGLVISTAFHIAVLAMGIITLEIDHTIMIYRDLTALGRFPVDIYKQPLQGILTYLIPVGIMVTLPGKALMGLVSPTGVLLSFAIGAVFLLISLRFWNFALTKYTSASS